MIRSQSIETIAKAINTLNDDEVAVLGEVAAGLLTGRRVYGALDIDGDERDMHREALEEVRDALVYAGAVLVRLQR